MGVEGVWKLSKEGSDYIPGIDKLPGSPPIILKLKGQSTTEALNICFPLTFDLQLSYTGILY